MKIYFLLVSLLFSLNVFSYHKVVYGEDNRVDIYEATDFVHVELARSTAAHISKSKLKLSDDKSYYSLYGKTLKDAYGVCEDEKFATQTTAARCSGFLVGDDLLVTAGHCVKSSTDCKYYVWVFDFAVHNEGDNEITAIDSKNVYGCKEIVETENGSYGNNDYALIKLDRKVTDRTPLKFRKSGKIGNSAPLVVIGHPTGLPVKISAGANVRSNSRKDYFVANLDTFGGNSGSAVFNDETAEVEGILVRGATDYSYDYQAKCRRPFICSEDGCRGEDVTRITGIKALMQ